jgi:hypothetical protein
MIDVERRLLFIHIARTGGTSIEAAFVGSDWWYVDAQSKHLSASQTRRYYGEGIWSSFVKFAVVRNPWDRLVSMWAAGAWRFGQDIDLSAFLRQLRPHPHELYQSLHYHEILDEELDYVLRFESLQTDLSRMLRERGIDDIVLPRVETSHHTHYSDYYSPEAAELARTMFRKDIELYGYKFESGSQAPAPMYDAGSLMLP